MPRSPLTLRKKTSKSVTHPEAGGTEAEARATGNDTTARLEQHFKQQPAGGDPSEQQWREEAKALVDEVAPDLLSHYLVRRIERAELKIRRALSFKAFMVQESESRRLGLQASSWMLDQKLAAYRFIDEIDVRRPAGDLATYKFEELPITPPVVLKPRRSTGSKGCYLITSERDITHVKDGATFDSLAAMTAHATALMRPDKRGRSLPDRWFAEELILEDRAAGTPARDLKFFCFYGQVLFHLEVRRQGGNSEYSFRTRDQNAITPGDWDYDYFDGAGTTTEEIGLAEEISLQIPHPFCRIDMLKGEDGLAFGEFTPRPGQYHRFSPQWDRRMGEEWARAQHRIQMDLLAGKDFGPFLRATDFLDRRKGS